MTIGQRIRARREQLGFSQAELAARIGEKPQTLYKYERNIVTNIPITTLEKIAEHLDVTPTYLMGWREKEDASPPAGELSYAQLMGALPNLSAKELLSIIIRAGEILSASEPDNSP